MLHVHRAFHCWLIAMVLVMASPPTARAGGIGDLFCRNGGFPTENSTFGVATVVNDNQAYFLRDMHGCPDDSPRCVSQYSVSSGTRVVTGRKHGKYICAYHSTTDGGHAGWLDADRLKAEPVDSKPSVSAWIGGWSDNGNPRVVFAANKGIVSVSGSAFWPGEYPDPEQFPYGPHMGGISGPVEISGNRAVERECNVSFVLLGDFLVGIDPDGECGGMNVRFSSVYTRDPNAETEEQGY